MLNNFSLRSHEDELMDTERCSFVDFRECLRDLAWVNSVTFAHVPTLQFLERLLERNRFLNRPLEIVDIGSGFGDTLRHIAAWARKRHVRVSLTGIDLNPWSKQAASQATRRLDDIAWVTINAFDYQPERKIDVVVSSLFTHHLSEDGVVSFLKWMESTAKLGWFVNDLHRHALPYHVFRQAAKLLRLHRFVQHDGPVSIARGFSSADWKVLLYHAGIKRNAAEVSWRFPFRLTVERFKDA
jgi:SAM-dependent methyltransferase